MRPYAKRVASGRKVCVAVKLDPCGHHNCAMSAGCGEITDCCEHCPSLDCHQGSGIVSTSSMMRDKRNRTIVELKDEGMPASEIAEITNLSQRRVWGVLAEV